MNIYYNDKTLYVNVDELRDIDKFKDISIDIEKKRKELGLENGDIMFLSVGELNKNKNHKIVIEAMHLLNGSGRLHYFIAGKDAGEYAAGRISDQGSEQGDNSYIGMERKLCLFRKLCRRRKKQSYQIPCTGTDNQ